MTPAKCRGSVKVRYLCDDDIVFLMKNLDDNASHSFFSRKDRYSPLWKSEAEFCALFHRDEWGGDLDRLRRLFDGFTGFLRRADVSELNDAAYKKLKREREKARKGVRQIVRDSEASFDKVIFAGQRDLFCGFVKVLEKFAVDSGCLFRFQILDAKMFKSGFENGNLSDILIELGRGVDDIVKFGNVTRVLGGRADNSSLPKNVYYIFAKGLSGDKVKLSRMLVASVKKYIHDNSDKIDKFFSKGK